MNYIKICLPWWMGVSVHVHQEWWGHEMGCLLCLFIKHKAVGITDQRPVVCVEEDLVWKLCRDQEEEKFNFNQLRLLDLPDVRLFRFSHAQLFLEAHCYIFKSHSELRKHLSIRSVTFLICKIQY